MAGQCVNNKAEWIKWHDIKLQKAWENLKNNTDYSMQRWPNNGAISLNREGSPTKSEQP